MEHNWKPTAPPAYIEYADICSNCGCVRLHANARCDKMTAYWKSIDDWFHAPYPTNEEPNCNELIIESVLL